MGALHEAISQPAVPSIGKNEVMGTQAAVSCEKGSALVSVHRVGRTGGPFHHPGAGQVPTPAASLANTLQVWFSKDPIPERIQEQREMQLHTL